MKTKIVPKIEWNFAPKKPEPRMITLKNGQKIVADVVHEFFTESIPAKKIWCTGCQEYFSSWQKLLFRHGMCQPQPGWPIKTPIVAKVLKKKNDHVPLPKDFSMWDVPRMKSWIAKHRPQNYSKIFGGA